MLFHRCFLKILNMSLDGSVVICGVLLLRVLLKKAPRGFSYALWSVVLLRLLCPVILTSPVGILRSNSIFRENGTSVSAPAAAPPQPVLTMDAESDKQDILAGQVPEAKADRKALETPCLILWAAGCGALLCLGLLQTVRLRRRLRGAAALEKGVWLADGIDTAFVLGVFKPAIYLSSRLSAEERAFVLAHERRHIRRGDQFWRLLAFAAACLHWFNPLVWVSYRLSYRDMEVSCDEAVIRAMDGPGRAAYAETLLAIASGNRQPSVAALSFGSGDMKERILAIMKYRKPRAGILIAAALLTLCAAAVFAFNAKSETPMEEPAALAAEDVSAGEPAQRRNHLVRAVGVDGTIGYVYESDLDGEQPNDPEEAMAYMEKLEQATQEARNRGDKYVRYIPLYDGDGTTVTDRFGIGNTDRVPYNTQTPTTGTTEPPKAGAPVSTDMTADSESEVAYAVQPVPTPAAWAEPDGLAPSQNMHTVWEADTAPAPDTQPGQTAHGWGVADGQIVYPEDPDYLEWLKRNYYVASETAGGIVTCIVVHSGDREYSLDDPEGLLWAMQNRSEFDPEAVWDRYQQDVRLREEWLENVPQTAPSD